MNIKKTIITGLATTLLTMPALFTATTVQAQSEGAETNIEYQMPDKSVSEIRNYAEEIGINVYDTEVIITDAQMIELFNYMGYDIEPDSSSGMFARAAGVTKIVSKGKGSWDIYLSKGFIKTYYAAGTVLSAGLTAAIAVLVPGVGWTVAATMVSTLSGIIGSEVTHGVVFRIRNWKITSAGKQ